MKRSGAVTLGSVLGLGILPSVTRKLQAQDTSGFTIQGVKVNWNGDSSSQTFPYFNGSLELGTALSCDVAKGACSIFATVHVLRYAVYRQVVNGVSYSASSFENAYYGYSCTNGIVSQSFEKGNGNGVQDVKDGSGHTLASVSLSPSAGSPQGGPKGQVYKDGSNWGPEMALAAVGFSASCCSF